MIKIKEVKTFEAKIAVGFREQYTDKIHTVDEAEKNCQAYCDWMGECVTVTPTKFIYKEGSEPGCIIGFIKYSRFSHENKEILGRALRLAETLKSEFNQNRVSVICNDKTYMIEQVEDV